MELMQWLTDTDSGRTVFTALVSMLPVVELRGGIPFGVGLGLGHWGALWASIMGNIFPVPFIVVYIRSVFKWMRGRSKWLNSFAVWLERQAHFKSSNIRKYRALGLCVFVAIPLPGTGAWTGATIAALLDMRLREAVPAICLGVVLAGIAVSGITYGFTSLFL